MAPSLEEVQAAAAVWTRYQARLWDKEPDGDDLGPALQTIRRAEWPDMIACGLPDRIIEVAGGKFPKPFRFSEVVSP